MNWAQYLKRKIQSKDRRVSEPAIDYTDLLSHARSILDPDIDDETVAYLAVRDAHGRKSRSQALAAVLDRLRSRIHRIPATEFQYEYYLQRVHDLEEGSDAAAHFEAVTGHRVQEVGVDYRTRKHHSDASAAMRRFARTTASLLGLYLILAGPITGPGSASTKLDEISDEQKPWDEQGFSPRGSAGRWLRGVGNQYRAAVAEADEARTQYLWFPATYDYSRLESARTTLRQGIREQEGHLEMAPSEAYLLLARLEWRLGDRVRARDLLHLSCIAGTVRVDKECRYTALDEF